VSRLSTSVIVFILALGMFETTTARGAVIESNEAAFVWTPATGPVAYYGVWLALNGEAFAENPDYLVDAPQTSVRADYGDSLMIRVAAFSADGHRGPFSEPSEVVRLEAPLPPPTIIAPPGDIELAPVIAALGGGATQLVLQLTADQTQLVDVGTSGSDKPILVLNQLVVGTPDRATTVRLLDADAPHLAADVAYMILVGLGRSWLCAPGNEPGLVIHEGSTLILGGVDLYAFDGTQCVYVNSLFQLDGEDPNLIPYDRGWLQLHGDLDADGVLDPLDNCITGSNPNQEDTDDDGIGDVCECSYDADRGELLLTADANGDGVVDGADFTVLSDHFGRADVGFAGGDFNCDGIVDGADYTLWTDNIDP
jgi:hypothetical protein